MLIEETKNGQRRSSHLIAQIIERLAQLAELKPNQSRFVFPGKTGLKPIDITSAWQQAVRQTKLEDFRFHDLRHTAATFCGHVWGLDLPRPKCSFRPLSFRKRRGLSSPVLSVDVADSRSHLCIRIWPFQPSAASPKDAARSVQY